MNRHGKLLLYLHTLRYLRPLQLYGRLWFRLYRPQPGLEPAPAVRSYTGLWRQPSCRQPLMYAPWGFRFLNEAHVLESARDWNHPDREKLWLYNLHYFDDFNAFGAAERQEWHRALIARWIAENPPGSGNGWEPYPLSLRLVNWIKWALAGNALEPEWVQSLAVQARWLRRRLEWHLLGNHLLANAKALVFAGLFFEGKEAEAWLAKGLNILAREVPEQVLPDGGHFERSPMYHSIILEDLLDLLNLTQAYPGIVAAAVLEGWREAAGRMLGWLEALCHPDGEIGFFNDAAFGVAPTPAELFAYGDRMGCRERSVESRSHSEASSPHPHLPPLGGKEPKVGISSLPRWFHLPDSGYIRLVHGPAVALLDVAPIGPDYLPGHGHADTLSFELSVFGQRVLVNSGTSCYGTGPERLRQRATAAHNTVVVDGENSSEVWGGFRVARRARPVGLSLTDGQDRICARCGHDGYWRLPGKPTHWRQWSLSEETLTIRDTIQGRFHQASAYFHFHPAIALEADTSEKNGIARLLDGRNIYWDILQGKGRLKASSYHPQFGVSQASQCLEVSLDDAESRVAFRWQ